jgi:hypothetical protein
MIDLPDRQSLRPAACCASGDLIRSSDGPNVSFWMCRTKVVSSTLKHKDTCAIAVHNLSDREVDVEVRLRDVECLEDLLTRDPHRPAESQNSSNGGQGRPARRMTSRRVPPSHALHTPERGKSGPASLAAAWEPTLTSASERTCGLRFPSRELGSWRGKQHVNV